jgi:ATP-dependent DNA helicase RecG
MENQKTEWKRQWRDEFHKELCGLANAQGGTLDIGRDDNGVIVGIDNVKQLLEELPNTIRHALGIVPSIELDKFILRRLGKTWDGMIVSNVKVSDLDTSAFRIFREKALISERLQKADLEMGDAELLDSLLLTENGELTRAAVLLFHHNPEKFVFGAFVKVGYFENGADLVYQDEFHGSLIAVADQIVDSIYRKYFKGMISYEGITRVTDYPIPRPALREAIFNAIVHRDYTTGIPIQSQTTTTSSGGLLLAL